jgi:hypothetical protein
MIVRLPIDTFEDTVTLLKDNGQYLTLAREALMACQWLEDRFTSADHVKGNNSTALFLHIARIMTEKAAEVDKLKTRIAELEAAAEGGVR